MIAKFVPTPPIGSTDFKIPLNKGKFALVDASDFLKLSRFKWRLFKSAGNVYAGRKIVINGKEQVIKMHRLIAHTPKELHCHHINHDTLDNRRQNLQNMTYFDHSNLEMMYRLQQRLPPVFELH